MKVFVVAVIAILFLSIPIFSFTNSQIRAQMTQDELCQGNTGINTAIGCIPIFGGGNDINPFLTFILRWALGIGGGIAFLLIVVSSFQITTSAGDPKKLQAGKELLTAAVMGLLLMIFSIFILRVVGVNILRIPGL